MSVSVNDAGVHPCLSTQPVNEEGGEVLPLMVSPVIMMVLMLALCRVCMTGVV